MGRADDERRYICFNEDGTGEYCYRDEDGNGYVTGIKWVYLGDSHVTVFYDSTVSLKNYGKSDVDTSRTHTFIYSEEVLVSVVGYGWICEDFLRDKLPSFGTVD